MANYLELKQQFDNNKTFIKQVLNDQKCQLRLKSEGLLTLKKLIICLRLITVNILIFSLMIKD